ncbi:MAG: integrase core domain-containing protein, partial [Pseudolabrys sp.]
MRDNDRAYGHVFTFRVGAMGIRDRPISPGSPWQNGYAERLIGTLRRECLDQVVIFGEAHLRRILSAYAAYYKALQKDAPFHRTAQRSGTIVANRAPIGNRVFLPTKHTHYSVAFSVDRACRECSHHLADADR